MLACGLRIGSQIEGRLYPFCSIWSAAIIDAIGRAHSGAPIGNFVLHRLWIGIEPSTFFR